MTEIRQLYFKQRFFSWFDSYDIYDEYGSTLYVVKGELAWGHQLRIYDAAGQEAGLIKEKVFSLLPRFELYSGGRQFGSIQKRLTLFRPQYLLEYHGWKVQGDVMGWNYTVTENGREIVYVSKELMRLTDTYRITVQRDSDVLSALMVVLAIDAANCSSRKQ